MERAEPNWPLDSWNLISRSNRLKIVVYSAKGMPVLVPLVKDHKMRLKATYSLTILFHMGLRRENKDVDLGTTRKLGPNKERIGITRTHDP